MNNNSIYNPEPWKRIGLPLREIYSDLIKHYDIRVGGEIVEQFSDKGTVHSYIEFYDKEFQPVRNYCRMLEIGLMTGASLKMWTEYFPLYQLAGIDLRDGWNDARPWQQDLAADANVELHFGIDSTKQIVDFEEPFNIILDDGAHDWQSQLKTFVNYWPQLKAGGVYYIEDVEDANSMELLKQGIMQHCAGETIAFNEHHGHLNGRRDDQILCIKRVKQ